MAVSRWVIITIISLVWSVLLVKGQVNVTFDPVFSVNESVGTFNICLNLNDSTPINTTINISVDRSSQAKNGTDFIIPSEVELEENILIVCINVSIINDNIIEANESATIIFSSDDDSELIFEHNSTQLIIMSFDELSVTVDNMNRTVYEGDTLNLCVSLSSSNYEFSFNVNVTAVFDNTTDSNDINSFTSQSLEFVAPNNTSCVSININNTDDPEGDEMFRIEWSLSGAPSNVRITPPTVTYITIKSQLMLSLVNNTNVAVTEGVTFKLCVKSNGVVGSPIVSINFNISGNTNSVTSNPNNLLKFQNGEKQTCVEVTSIDNSTILPPKMVTFTFFNPIGANFNGPNTTTVTIEDNSTALVGFNKAMSSVQENTIFQPQLTIFEGQIYIDFTISITAINGTAKAGVDFNFTGSITYNWNMGSPPVILINILDNDIVEGDKRFSLNLTVNSNLITTNTSDLSVVIVDNDMSILSIPKSVDVSESAGSVRLCFIPSTQIAPKSDGSNYTLAYRTENDKARAGRDFTSASGQVDIPSLTISSQCISITIMSNNIMEGRRNFFVFWSLESGILPGVILDNNITNVTITDDDSTPLPSSSSPPLTTTPPPETSSAFPLFAIVGVIVGVVLACLLFFIVLLLVILCFKVRTNRQGFYPTYEDKGDAPQMLRYSASLRSLQSQTVMPADPRDKENEYLV